ncbi:hypothetical protein [Rhodopila sp.]|uniref:hypothetical protein n=1 Tax=Rhodopila sp. TaxID=2480087 RepID=UPI003D0B3DA5
MRNQDPPLTANETRSLRCVAGMMIPASAAHGVPGADDDTIFTDILGSIGLDAALVKQALQRLDALAGGVFCNLDPVRREAAAAALREAGGAPLTALTGVIVQCYYRDERVMRSLGMEVRPPFPKGFEVEQGDWSLLDPVRRRAAFYRSTC